MIELAALLIGILWGLILSLGKVKPTITPPPIQFTPTPATPNVLATTPTCWEGIWVVLGTLLFIAGIAVWAFWDTLFPSKRGE